MSNQQHLGFFRFENGSLFCEDLEIESIVNNGTVNRRSCSLSSVSERIFIDEPLTPVYVYSQSSIRQNIGNYVEAMKTAKLSGKIGYAIKANPNLEIVKMMREFGVDMIIAVSGYEVLTALESGFAPENVILNGNGKQDWEIKLALEMGVLLNVDSLFDAKRIVAIYTALNNNKDVKVFLRIRPNKPHEQHVQITVHEYVNTAEKSKFGFHYSELDDVLAVLSSSERIKIIGIHCHFGSGISNPSVYEWLGSTVTEIKNELRARGVPIDVINVGGGIGINYFEKPPGLQECLTGVDEASDGNAIPHVSKFLTALSANIPKNINIIVEPGRSLIAKAGILVCKVLGTKESHNRKITVVDGSMNEIIRPCLYGAHHEIYPTKIMPNEHWEISDIVGPICESSDFLGKQVMMQRNAAFVAVMDAGAYCSSMASTYNLKPRAAEILVNGNKWTYIREKDTFEDIFRKRNSK